MISTYVYGMTEGMTPAEQGLSDATTVDVASAIGSYATIFTYNLPVPAGSILKAGIYEVTIRGYSSGGGSTVFQLALTASGGTFTSADISSPGSDADMVGTVTVGADTGATSLSLVVKAKSVGGAYICHMRPIHADVRFGAQSASTGCPRTAFAVTPNTPAVGSHTVPTMISASTPTLIADFAGVYPDDHVTLVKYADTYRTSGHSPSGATTQTVGNAVDYTTSFPSAAVRRISVTADATRKADAYNNSDYVFTIKTSGDIAVGTLTYEVCLSVLPATLLTLNGATSGAYVSTLDLEPLLKWSDPNAGLTTHWRARVYRASDSALIWDSTETAVGPLQVKIPAAAGLISFVTYYWVLTLENGAGGSGWSIDSAMGYFQTDNTSTAVKITNLEGSSDAPVIITTVTPEVDWYFAKTQQSFMVSVFDEGVHAVAFNTPWTVSATESYTIPAHT